jgi:hypothetical protein
MSSSEQPLTALLSTSRAGLLKQTETYKNIRQPNCDLDEGSMYVRNVGNAAHIHTMQRSKDIKNIPHIGQEGKIGSNVEDNRHLCIPVLYNFPRIAVSN